MLGPSRWQLLRNTVQAMEYSGYNGKITVEGDLLLLEHQDLSAKVAGLGTGRPRRIPLQTVSGVAIKPASRFMNGWLTLGLGGAAAPEVTLATAASHPDTILFRHKSRDQFQTLYEWLNTVVAYNREHGIDASAVAFDAGQASLPPDAVVPPAPSDEPLAATPAPFESAHVDVTDTDAVGASGRGRLSRRERSAERAGFESLAMAAAHGDEAALRSLPAALDDTRAHWRSGKLERRLWEVLVAAIREVGADDILSVAEEKHLVALALALGLNIDDLRTKAPGAFEELVVCMINDGRPPTLSNPPIMTKRDEIAHGVFAVALMKEVTKREFRGGSSGVSIPLGGGVRYRAGGFRGRSVVVGTELVAEDSGRLAITSARTVFTGGKKTLEFRHDRLVGMHQYNDGLRLNVSNRQTASLFKFGRGESPMIAAALITSAASRVL
jgi:hypothetical protein